MKASEFIRVFGLDIARMAINECPPEYDLDTVELKRLVESHELIIVWRMPESWRDDYDGDKLGLEGARMYLDMHGNHELVGEELERFKQAITDVEACEGVS